MFANAKSTNQIQALEFFSLVLRQRSSIGLRRGWDLVFELVRKLHYEMVQASWAVEVLYMAVISGYKPLTQRIEVSA